MLQYTVGMRIGRKSEQAAVEAEDALAAALKAKEAYPDAMITYVRKRNERGDVRHPHKRIGSDGSAVEVTPAEKIGPLRKRGKATAG